MSVRPRTSPTLLALVLAACADLTAPSSDDSANPDARVRAATAAAAPAAARPRSSAAAARARGPADAERISASHILIGYQGARRSQATRSKEEAQKLAQQIAGKAKQGQDFAALARQHSEEPSSKAQGGRLRPFNRRGMVRPFSDAAFALKPGEVSGVVQTPFGFHIIKRTN